MPTARTERYFPCLPQAAKLLPEQPPPSTDPDAAAAAKKLLATRLGHFLRTCPGLNKTTIGELLGDPDPFYLEVRSYAASIANGAYTSIVLVPERVLC